MTDFALQKILVKNCEHRIERNYYDWGRERSRSEWVDPEWDVATAEQRRHVSLRGYALYDGCSVPRDNQINSIDAWVSAGFRSRVIEFDVVRILARAEKANQYLTYIPPNAALESATDKEIEAAGPLISVFTDAYQLNWGKITKVLHKKRPGFMPVLDSVVWDFLWKNFPHIINQASPFPEVLKLCRIILQLRYAEVGTIRRYLWERGFDLTPLRVLDFVLWIGWRDGGFGRPITEVWNTGGLYEARRQARIVWDEALADRVQFVPDFAPPVLDPEQEKQANTPTITLLDAWLEAAHNKKTRTAEELRAAEEDLETFKRNMNAPRKEAGDRLLYPEVEGKAAGTDTR